MWCKVCHLLMEGVAPCRPNRWEIGRTATQEARTGIPIDHIIQSSHYAATYTATHTHVGTHTLTTAHSFTPAAPLAVTTPRLPFRVSS